MAGDFGDFLSSMWGDVAGIPAGSFDPYKQDRGARMQALTGAMGNYDKSMSTPGGFIPDQYRKMLLSQSDEGIASARPGAGGSGWLADAQARARNDVNLKLAQTELDQANQQRNYIATLMGQQMPEQYRPQQGGMLQKAGGNLAGRATNAFGRSMFGNDPQEDAYSQYLKMMMGGKTNTPGNLNASAGNPGNSGGFGNWGDYL
jgi:hypothetical protein